MRKERGNVVLWCGNKKKKRIEDLSWLRRLFSRTYVFYYQKEFRDSVTEQSLAMYGLPREIRRELVDGTIDSALKCGDDCNIVINRIFKI